MAFDECVKLPATPETIAASCARTTRWLDRCISSYRGPGSIFGIVQGGLSRELRSRPRPRGSRHAHWRVTPSAGSAWARGKRISTPSAHSPAALLPEDKPRYLMGVGTPDDLVRAVSAGVDMFDCVLPTRNARNGTLSRGRASWSSRTPRTRKTPVRWTPRCACYTCRTFSRAYLRHLFVSEELLAYRLLSLHNMAYFMDLMRRVRKPWIQALLAPCWRKRLRRTLPGNLAFAGPVEGAPRADCCRRGTVLDAAVRFGPGRYTWAHRSCRARRDCNAVPMGDDPNAGCSLRLSRRRDQSAGHHSGVHWHLLFPPLASADQAGQGPHGIPQHLAKRH